MKIKKRWMYIVFVLVFLPIPAYSQLVSPSKLESGKYNFRLGYVRNLGNPGYVEQLRDSRRDSRRDSHGMWLGGARGLGDRTKVSTSASIFFDATDKTVDDIYQSSQIVHITPLGSIGLDCFFFGDFGVFIDRDTIFIQHGPKWPFEDFDFEREGGRRFMSMWLGGGLGLSKTLGRFTPFVGLFYRHTVYTYTRKYELEYEYETDNKGLLLWYTFRGERELLRSVGLSMGAEIEITQHIDLAGSFELRLENREVGFSSNSPHVSAFYIGLSLH